METQAASCCTRSALSDVKMVLKLATLVLSGVICVACGKGPKHLSEAQYNAGKTAMEMLDREASTTDAKEQEVWTQAASSQMEQIGSKNLDLYTALTDYSVAIEIVTTARLKQIGAQLELDLAEREQSLKKSKAAVEELKNAQSEEVQGRVTVKLCRDEVDQWFTADAPATNTCHSIIEKHSAAQKWVR